MNSDCLWLIQIRSLLHHNVPRFIACIKQRGGVSADEWTWLQCQENSPDYPEGIFNEADRYLMYPKNMKIFKQGLSVLTRAVAIMSFIPGGIHLLNLHFCSEIDNFVAIEDDTSIT